jgi:NADH-quinone oxidoreductase subunit H
MTGRLLFQILLFPGLLFTAGLGLVVGWVDRKVSARFQFRVGPPFFQVFNDIAKLLGKETLLVRDGVRWLFIAAPLAALGTLALAATIVGAALFLGEGVGGDLIVVMYLLMLYALLVALGGSAAGNVFASVGAGREIKLLLADELAFLLVCLVPVIQSGYRLRLTDILAYQSEQGAIIGSFSGALAFIVGLLAVQAKMALPPFHIAEAETELAGGPFIEYSGPLLAFWKVSQVMMFAVFPFLLILLFWGGVPRSAGEVIGLALKYLLVVVLLIIIKNTNPRVRLDTALGFFWKWAAPAAFVAVVLAVLGV